MLKLGGSELIFALEVFLRHYVLYDGRILGGENKFFILNFAPAFTIEYTLS